MIKEYQVTMICSTGVYRPASCIIKSEEIEIDFILPNEKITSVIFSIKGMSLEEVVEEILRRIDL